MADENEDAVGAARPNDLVEGTVVNSTLAERAGKKRPKAAGDAEAIHNSTLAERAEAHTKVVEKAEAEDKRVSRRRKAED